MSEDTFQNLIQNIENEKFRVIEVYAELEGLRHQAETGMKILVKLYPWLEEVVRQ